MECSAERPSSFNGATLSKRGRRMRTEDRAGQSLQWGHAEHSVEDAASPDPATDQVMLQWGHAEHSVEDVMACGSPRTVIAGFNGATLSTAWKTGDSTVKFSFQADASMGPR